MTLYTMGISKKSAEIFFHIISGHNVHTLIDVRLKNNSQLLGFTKQDDLAYFLHELTTCRYFHEPDFAPTEDILKSYRRGWLSWDGYAEKYIHLMQERDVPSLFHDKYGHCKNVLFLCSEVSPEYCHRRLLAETLSEQFGYKIVHL